MKFRSHLSPIPDLKSTGELRDNDIFVPRKRGRPQKVKILSKECSKENLNEISEKEIIIPPCKRGRPRKVKAPSMKYLKKNTDVINENEIIIPPPCKRGRPRKVKGAPRKNLQEELYEITPMKTKVFFLNKTPENSKKNLLASWQRVFSKYSPTTETLFSPIKAVQANLSPRLIFNDAYVDIYVWVINMSEQFYYDNTLLLLNGSKYDPSQTNKVLRRNFKNVDILFFTNLVDLILLGKGSFGSVYSCTDLKTKTKYAVKYIGAKYKKQIEHCENILDYMAERNSIIRAMNSPFVTSFYYSLKVQSIGGLFLFFEFCIGDLSKYIKFISLNDYKTLSKNLYNNESDIIQNLDKDVGLLDVSLMYIFEMFCGLDFLVRANIIHLDIKPDNLMISQTLHLKIGDFGIVYRTRMIHRETNRELVTHEEANIIESRNYELTIHGTPYYYDFETLLASLQFEKHPFYGKFKRSKDIFDVPGVKLDDDSRAPTFLTDTWAAGMVAVNLLFRGFDILDPDQVHPLIFADVPRGNPSEFSLHLIGRKSIYKKYIKYGLIKSGGKDHKELMEFIASIFKPRSTRAKEYTLEKTIFRYIKKRTVRYIDMEKVERIKSFQIKHFTPRNVFTLQVPEAVKDIYKSYKRPKFSTFQELLGFLSKRSTGQNIIDLKPGLTINNFP